MALLCVSDLHLDAARPAKLALFERFLAAARERCSALYVLGDLFELWLGDDDLAPPHDRILAALARFADGGPALLFAHGNHDFLIGAEFCARTGAVLLPDWCRIEAFGTAMLLGHGDLLCTDDVGYQAMRRRFRDPAFQREFLARPLAARRAYAFEVQQQSAAALLGKDDRITDVTQAAVVETMRAHDVTRLIHGHTHRPGIHRFDVDGRACERIVMGDWYTQESVAVIDERGVRLAAVQAFVEGS